MATITKTIGSAGDYSTFAALVADAATAWSVADNAVIELVDNAVYDETFDLELIYTAVAVASITLRANAAVKHSGTAGTGARIVRTANGTPNQALVQATDACDTTIEDLEISVATGFGWDRLVSGSNGGAPAGYLTVQRNLIHDNRGRVANTAHGYGLFVGKAAASVQNNIIYNITHARSSIDIYGICQLATSGNNALISNNTVYNIGTGTADAVHGIFLTGATSGDIVRNNLVIGLVAGTGLASCLLLSSATVNNNASSDTSATGTGSLTNRSAGTEFRDLTSGGENLLLSSLSTAFESGADLGTTPSGVKFDILGRDRDTESDTWSIGASQLTDAAVNDITLTSPQAYQVIQRNGDSGTLTISGTYTGTATTIEYSFDGGDWTTLDATPADGAFSESITLTAGDQGTVSVRFSNDTDATDSAAFVGCGDIFAIYGQSNASGRGLNSRFYSGTLKACQYTGSGWQELTDPADSDSWYLDSVATDSGSAGGHWAHQMATDLMADLGVPVAILIVAKGGTGIASFVPGADHLNRATLYGSLNYHIVAVGGVKAVLWWQGETDAIAAMSQATYNGHLDTIANALQADRGVNLMPCLLQNSSGITDGLEQAIRDAVTEAAGDNSNVLLGPDFSAIGSDDAYHFTGNTKVDNAGTLWAESIVSAFFPSISNVAVASIVLVDVESAITWDSVGVSSTVDILLDGVAFASGVSNSGSFAWTPTAGQVTGAGVLRVRDAADSDYFAEAGVVVATTSGGGLQNTDLWYRLKQAAIDNGLEIIEQ